MLALHLEPVTKVQEEIRGKGKKGVNPQVCFRAQTNAKHIHSIFRANERIT
jgi:hypothetical protein